MTLLYIPAPTELNETLAYVTVTPHQQQQRNVKMEPYPAYKQQRNVEMEPCPASDITRPH